MTKYKKTLLFVHCFIGIAGFHVSDVMAQGARVDICHFPPGNPENVQTITISENALETHLDHGDSIGACDPEQTVELREPAPQPASACACPTPGVWRVTNLDGYMECSALGVRRTLRGAAENDGAIWILDDSCSTIFNEAYERDAEDVIMTRGRECLFFGSAPGEEDGAEVIFDGAYRLENSEFITGEFYLEMTGGGLACSGFRPFEISFLEPLDEDDYAELEETMQERLDEAREVLEEHREQIDAYLEETNGGRAFGGRNGQE
jgi:hypothetical protein